MFLSSKAARGRSRAVSHSRIANYVVLCLVYLCVIRAPASAQAPTLVNSGFESPDVGYSHFQQNPTGAGWTFSFYSGISNNHSPFTIVNPNAPEGNQVAYLQGTGTISQSAVFSAGTYSLSFYVGQRWQNYQIMEVFVDSTLVARIAPSGTGYSLHTTDCFTVPAGSHTILFQGIDPESHLDSVFIDAVTLTQISVTNVPTAPAGFGAAASRMAVLSWTPVCAASSYKLYRGTTPGGEGTLAYQSNIAGTSFTDTGLTNGAAYYYKVSAVNALGEGQKSNEITVIPAPAFLNSSFETPNFGNSSYQQNPPDASWTFSPFSGISSNGSGFTSSNPNAPQGDQVAILQDTGTFSQSINLPAGIYSISFLAAQRSGGIQDFQVLVDGVVVGTCLPNGPVYDTYSTDCFSVSDGSHTVTFQGLNNHTGDNTAFIDAVTIAAHDNSAPPPAPTGLAAVAGNNQITIHWTSVCTAASYNIYRSRVSGGEGTTPFQTGVTGTSFTDTGLTNGAIYYYKVAAVDAAGLSPMSAEVSASGAFVFLNSGFETPNLGDGGYSKGLTGASWTFSTFTGISNNDSPFTGSVPAPEGTQVGILQSTDSFSQTIYLLTGTYKISFYAAHRGTDSQDFQVQIDGNTVGTFTPPDQTYTAYSTSYFSVPTGNHVVAFKGIDTRGAQDSALIDVVTIGIKRVVTSISVSPSTATVNAGATRQFTATALDQFGNTMSPQPALTWTVTGGNTINSTGLFTAGGAAGGPFTVTAASGSVSGTASVTVTAPSVHVLDFNGDGKADLVLQNVSVGKVALWYMNGASLLSGAYVSAALPSGWNVVSQGDFNGDGKPDLLLQNATTNQIALWYLNGATLTGGAYLGTTPAAGWKVVGSGDFNGDGKRDLVLQNVSTNVVSFSYLNGTTVTSSANMSTTPPAAWKAVGAADFNGDGKLDLVLQNAASRQVAVWYLNGVSVTGGAYVSSLLPSGWSVAGVGDVNADGKPDLVLQNATTNQVALWYLNGVTLLGGAYTSVTPGSGWKVVGPR